MVRGNPEILQQKTFPQKVEELLATNLKHLGQARNDNDHQAIYKWGTRPWENRQKIKTNTT